MVVLLFLDSINPFNRGAFGLTGMPKQASEFQVLREFLDAKAKLCSLDKKYSSYKIEYTGGIAIKLWIIEGRDVWVSLGIASTCDIVHPITLSVPIAGNTNLIILVSHQHQVTLNRNEYRIPKDKYLCIPYQGLEIYARDVHSGPISVLFGNNFPESFCKRIIDAVRKGRDDAR
jgi:hypothetical protein